MQRITTIRGRAIPMRGNAIDMLGLDPVDLRPQPAQR